MKKLTLKEFKLFAKRPVKISTLFSTDGPQALPPSKDSHTLLQN